MNTDLMQAFNFTEEDLTYNRMGKLSPQQVARFGKTKNKGIAAFIVMTLASGAGAFFVLQPFVFGGLSISDNIGRFLGGVALAGLALLFFYFSFQTDGPVMQKIQGKAQFVSREESTTDAEGHTTHYTAYYVIIGDREFSVQVDQYQAFNQGHIYTVYNDNFLLGILSIEYNGPPTS